MTAILDKINAGLEAAVCRGLSARTIGLSDEGGVYISCAEYTQGVPAVVFVTDREIVVRRGTGRPSILRRNPAPEATTSTAKMPA